MFLCRLFSRLVNKWILLQNLKIALVSTEQYVRHKKMSLYLGHQDSVLVVNCCVKNTPEFNGLKQHQLSDYFSLSFGDEDNWAQPGSPYSGSPAVVVR